MIDWGEAEAKGGKQYKDYAPHGVHTVKVEKVDIHRLDTGSVAEDFHFAEDDYQYPKSTHWLSFGNDNFRFLHQRNLMMVLGASKEDAQKAVEVCESKSGEDAKIKAYQQTFDRLLQKQPTVEIETHTSERNPKYDDAEFTAPSVRFDNSKKKNEDPMSGAVELTTKETKTLEIPF